MSCKIFAWPKPWLYATRWNVSFILSLALLFMSSNKLVIFALITVIMIFLCKFSWFQTITALCFCLNIPLTSCCGILPYCKVQNQNYKSEALIRNRSLVPNLKVFTKSSKNFVSQKFIFLHQTPLKRVRRIFPCNGFK